MNLILRVCSKKTTSKEDLMLSKFRYTFLDALILAKTTLKTSSEQGNLENLLIDYNHRWERECASEWTVVIHAVMLALILKIAFLELQSSNLSKP